MIKCGNRECKHHDDSAVYTICKMSIYKDIGRKDIYINLCPNENKNLKEEKCIDS